MWRHVHIENLLRNLASLFLHVSAPLPNGFSRNFKSDNCSIQCVLKMQFSLKADEHIGHFTWITHARISALTRWPFVGAKNVTDRRFRGKWNIFFVGSNDFQYTGNSIHARSDNLLNLWTDFDQILYGGSWPPAPSILVYSYDNFGLKIRTQPRSKRIRTLS